MVDTKEPESAAPEASGDGGWQEVPAAKTAKPAAQVQEKPSSENKKSRRRNRDRRRNRGEKSDGNKSPQTPQEKESSPETKVSSVKF